MSSFRDASVGAARAMILAQNTKLDTVARALVVNKNRVAEVAEFVSAVVAVSNSEDAKAAHRRLAEIESVIASLERILVFAQNALVRYAGNL